MPGNPGCPGGPSMNPVGKPLLSVIITGARDVVPFSPLRPCQPAQA